MIGFSYIYKNSDEVLESVSHLSSMNSIDILLLIWVIITVLLCIFIIFPCIIVSHRYKIEKKEKKNKKKLLTQILLQKEIEDEVEKEVHIEEEKKVT